MTDILAFSAAQWIGGFPEIAVPDAPHAITLHSFTSDNSVLDGTVSITYSGFQARIRDWFSIDLAPYDVPPRARAIILGMRYEIRHQGDTDPGGNTQSAMWVYTRPPGEQASRTAAWATDGSIPTGGASVGVAGQTAIFVDVDGIRSPQVAVVPLVDRRLEVSYGYKNFGTPNRSLIRFRIDLSLMGWLGG